jgi:glyoxylase-like metal-dependent hydrolase (beta-lactamase superfamily II)
MQTMRMLGAGVIEMGAEHCGSGAVARVAGHAPRAECAAMTSPLPAWLQDLKHGIYAIDTGFHRDDFDAAYLMVEHGRAAFIDSGTMPGLPRLLGALDALGIERSAVDWVVPTHVHLDHAGAVGGLMAALPSATLLVHPRGLRHMVDPTALWAGATAVYGQEEMARSYGQLVPVPAERAKPSADGMTFTLAGRELLVADTPGHARHHHCIWDARSRGWFTGDTFGLSYREFDTARGAWVLPTSTPVQFEPEALVESIERLLAKDPACMYLTHYSHVTDVPRLGALLLQLLRDMAAMGRAAQHAPDRHEALKRGQLDLFATSLHDHGCTFDKNRIAELLSVDLELNAQGMAVWLDRAAAAATHPSAKTAP